MWFSGLPAPGYYWSQHHILRSKRMGESDDIGALVAGGEIEILCGRGCSPVYRITSSAPTCDAPLSAPTRRMIFGVAGLSLPAGQPRRASLPIPWRLSRCLG